MISPELKAKIGSGFLFFIIIFLAIPGVSHAQVLPSSFVFAEQGITASSTATTTALVYAAQIGKGYVGTTTEAFVSVEASFSTTPSSSIGFLQLFAYSDASYSTLVLGGTCTFQSSDNGSHTYGPDFTQLDPSGCSGSATYTFNPNYYYVVQVTLSPDPTNATTPFTMFGISPPSHAEQVNESNQGAFEPMWALTGNGFFITPTASSTGLDLSGANAFCNSILGTSTGLINGIATDFANGTCQALGYLFVPTPNSIQQFQQLEPLLSQRVPFSYVSGVQSTWNSLTASSSTNIPQYQTDMSSAGIGSTTALGNILPTRMDLLSSSTVNKFLPSGIHDALYTLAEVAIALIAVAGMYEEGKRLIHT